MLTVGTNPAIPSALRIASPLHLNNSAQPPISALGWAAVTLAAILTLTLCLHLAPEWLNNPDLSHGLLAPILFLFLIREGRLSNHAGWHPAATMTLKMLRAGTLAAGLALVGMAGLYAATTDWTHPLVGFCLAVALSALLFGALLWCATPRVRILPLNWSTLVAVGFWPLCAPIPPGTYARITLQLQLWITQLVLESLHVLGIAASKAGNIILLAHTQVGVEEACSGVRSLLSCIVAALVFSATLVTRPWRRVLLLLLAPPLAFVLNFARSLALTLLAHKGVDITGHWHDLTGFAVLGSTALILGALAFALASPPAPPAPITPAFAASRGPHTGAGKPWDVLTAYVLTFLLLTGFLVNTHRATALDPAPPDLEALLPKTAATWDWVPTDNLQPFAPVLKTDHLIQRTYVRRQDANPEAEPLQLTVYLAYWAPAQVSVSAVALHTPEACWPGNGWTADQVESNALVRVPQRELPPPQYRSFTLAGNGQHVWYWHLYAGHSITQTNPYSAVELLRFAWRYGFRTEGAQVFVRISCNRPWSEIANDPLLAEILGRLQPYGL